MKATLEERIEKERNRRLRFGGGGKSWHYWERAGRRESPYEEFWCDYCAGWFGVPHGEFTHRPGSFCRSMGQSGQCACIDCWVYDGRKDPA